MNVSPSVKPESFVYRNVSRSYLTIYVGIWIYAFVLSHMSAFIAFMLAQRHNS